MQVNVSNRVHADYLEGHVAHYIWKVFSDANVLSNLRIEIWFSLLFQSSPHISFSLNHFGILLFDCNGCYVCSHMLVMV